MNYEMNEFAIVSLQQNILQTAITFEINNISELLRTTCVGEFVKSQTFVLHFPMSIGYSKWVVVLFLNGQYDSRGSPDKRVSVYLRMISCEKESVALKLDVKFQFEQVHSLKIDTLLCFKEVRMRWVGTQLLPINEITDCRDSMLLSMYLNEVAPQRCNNSITETVSAYSTTNVSTGRFLLVW